MPPAIDPKKRTAGAGAAQAPTGGVVPPRGPAKPQAPASTPAPSPAPAQTAQAPAGTGFVNLSRVLEANRGASKQMGQKLVQGVQAKGQQAQQATTAAQNTFSEATTKATPTHNPALAGASTAALLAKQATGDQPFFYGNTTATLADGRADTGAQNLGFKTQVTAADEDLAVLDPLTKVEYAGPKDWDAAGINTAGLTAQATAAQEEAAALGTTGGRQALLARGAQGAGYSSGARALDSALLGDAVGGEASEVSSQFSTLADTLAKARDGAGGIYDGAKAKQAEVNAKYAADAEKIKKAKTIAEAGAAATERPNLYSHTRMPQPIGTGAANPAVLPRRNPYTGGPTGGTRRGGG